MLIIIINYVLELRIFPLIISLCQCGPWPLHKSAVPCISADCASPWILPSYLQVFLLAWQVLTSSLDWISYTVPLPLAYHTRTLNFKSNTLKLYVRPPYSVRIKCYTFQWTLYVSCQLSFPCFVWDWLVRNSKHRSILSDLFDLTYVDGFAPDVIQINDWLFFNFCPLVINASVPWFYHVFFHFCWNDAMLHNFQGYVYFCILLLNTEQLKSDHQKF